VSTALLCGAGYIIAISSVLVVSGWFLSYTLAFYLGWNIPWIILSVLLTGGAVVMMLRGVGVSTRLAGFFFGFEMLVLIVVSVVLLVKNGGHLSLAPFEPRNITHGFTGLAAGFPLAVYLFIGWENSAALAEETGSPRRNVPRAVYLSVALMLVSYVLFAYATVSGFGYNGAKLSASSDLIPFITVAHGALASLAFFAYLAGLTSTLGVLIAAVNSQARLIFNAGREGLLPRWIGRVQPGRQTPRNAIFTFVGVASAIILVWALLHLIGGHSGSMNGLSYFDESGTMGTILILVVYFLANLALPFYYRKYRPSEFSILKHLILPVLGMIAIAIPVYYLSKPGQLSPYDWFPYAALGILIVSVLYAFVLTIRDPGLGARVGSIVADE
jgi:amino acid transporter